MSSVFIVDNTDGTLSLVMEPGSLNGPGSGTRDSDLRLYGSGALLWGEGVNENLLRIAESWACEEKGGSPGVPQDETDLGPGRGITTPLIGQPWYNKTTEELFIYNGTVWAKSSSVGAGVTPPIPAVVGDLWYDTSGTANPCGTDQMVVYNGAIWVSVAVDYLSLCGGTMLGDIDMGTNSILNLATPTDIDVGNAANVQYVLDKETSILASLSGHSTDADLHLTVDQNTILDSLETNLGGADPTTTGIDISKIIGFNTAFGGNDVPTEMGNRIRKTATDTMTAGQTIVLGRDPTAPLEAATRQWVQAEVATVAPGSGDRVVQWWSTLSASALDGDIHTAGGIIYIRIGGVWEQVFPAQYS